MRSLGRDRLGPAEVDVCRVQIVDALMMADVAEVFDEGVKSSSTAECQSSLIAVFLFLNSSAAPDHHIKRDRS